MSAQEKYYAPSPEEACKAMTEEMVFKSWREQESEDIKALKETINTLGAKLARKTQAYLSHSLKFHKKNDKAHGWEFNYQDFRDEALSYLELTEDEPQGDDFMDHQPQVLSRSEVGYGSIR